MAESLFIKVDEVGELLGISRAEAYRIIKKLNSELAEKGYIVISGRVSRRYLEEQIYGMGHGKTIYNLSKDDDSVHL